ncbi:hypothetical protein HQ571_03810 [Candidatus Kuenenbacteria bacterium]|nr:hypothetical protein [Candidatus Kuenenbacteria bacterium]
MAIAISIGVAILSLIVVYLMHCLIGVDEVTFAVIKRLNKQFAAVKEAGWHLIKPWENRSDTISLEEKSYNIPPFEMHCTVKDSVTLGTTGREVGKDILMSREISLSYEPKFDLNQSFVDIRKQLIGYYKLMGKVIDKTTEKEITVLEERLRDISQAMFRQYVNGLQINQARNLEKDDVRAVFEMIETAIIEEDLPVKLTDLHVNEPFVPRKETQDLLDQRGHASLQMEVDLATAEKDRQVAVIEIETAKAHAEAKKISLVTLAETFEKTPSAEEARRYIKELKALDAFATMSANPNKTFLFSADILSEITAMFGKVNGGS